MRSNICDVECSDGGSDSDSNGRRDLLTSAGQNQPAHRLVQFEACEAVAARRPASVGGSGSVSDQQSAACVGGSRERARPATPGALTPSPHAFRLPRTPHEHAHALAHATRDARDGLPGCPTIPLRARALTPTRTAASTPPATQAPRRTGGPRSGWHRLRARSTQPRPTRRGFVWQSPPRAGSCCSRES